MDTIFDETMSNESLKTAYRTTEEEVEGIDVVFFNGDEYQRLLDRNYTIIQSPSNLLESERMSFPDIILCVLYCVVLLAGFCSNVFVLNAVRVVLKSGQNKTQSILVFIFCMSCINMVICMFMPFTIVDMVFGTWPFSNLVCKIHWTLETWNKTVTSVVISLLTVSCYCAVCRPTMRKLYDSKLCAMLQVIVGLVTVFVKSRLIVNDATVVHFGHMDPESKTIYIYFAKCLINDNNNESTVSYFTICSFVCGYVIPFLTMVLCYGSILYKIRFRMPFEKRRLKSFRKILRSVLILGCFYLISWTPYWGITLAVLFSNSKLESNSFTSTVLIVHLFPYINCAFSTLMYSLLNKEIFPRKPNLRKRSLVASYGEFRKMSRTSQFTV